MTEKKQLKIFIVDDDIFCTAFYEQYLVSLGYKDVRSFNDGKDCINHLSQEPGVVFSNFQMRPFDGMDMLKKIKKFNPHIYLIILSGLQDKQLAIDTFKNGAFDYIIKGENELERIREVLEKIHCVIKLLDS